MIIVQAFENPSAALLKAALMHDLPEGATGDIPGPVKWSMGKEFCTHLKDLEQKVFKFYEIQYPNLSDDEIKMLKSADFIDATFTCLMERANGNREVDWVFSNYCHFEESNRPLDLYSKLKDVWFRIRKSYESLQRQDPPISLNIAEKANFWEHQ